MRSIRRVLVVLAAALAMSACGDDASKVAPTNAPEATASPAPAVIGPILVYTKETPQEERTGSVETFVVAYDVGAGREIRRSTVPQVITPVFVKTTGQVLYLTQGGPTTDVRGVDALTGVDSIVYQGTGGLEWGIALSPDGGSLAVSEIAPPDDQRSPTLVRIADVASGSARTIATFTDYHGDVFRGRPTPRVWRADGTGILVSGDTGSGAPGSWGTVMLDGTVKEYGKWFAWPSPNGRLLAISDMSGAGCVLAPTQRFSLFDVDANAEVASVEDAGRGMVIRQWSPDGEALLYDQFDAVAGTADDSCLPTADVATRRSFLLKPGIAAPEPVADGAALLAAWQPEARIELTCVNGVANGFDTCPGVDRRNLIVNGTKIDSGDSIRIAGFLPGAH